MKIRQNVSIFRFYVKLVFLGNLEICTRFTLYGVQMTTGKTAYSDEKFYVKKKSFTNLKREIYI